MSAPERPASAEIDAVRVEAARVERLAAVLYGNPDHWCRGTGMNRPYWRRQARKALDQTATAGCPCGHVVELHDLTAHEPPCRACGSGEACDLTWTRVTPPD